MPKDNGRCEKCAHKFRYVRALDGFTDPDPAGVKPTPEKNKRTLTKHGDAQTCWWRGCFRKVHTRGLCKSHYTIFHAGRLTVWLNHTGLDAREELYRTIMRMASEHQITLRDALAILVDEGAVQYRKRC
jgi:hypothetical protein